MAIIQLPQQTQRRTGLQDFTEGMSPYLQAAFQAQMQRQLLQEQQAYETQQKQQDQQIKMLGMGYQPAPTSQENWDKAYNLTGTIPVFKGQKEKFNRPVKVGEKDYAYNPVTMTGKPVFTFDENGSLVNVGTVPKGSQVVPPSSFETPTAKAEREKTSAVQKESGIRANKLNELGKAVDFFEQKIGEIPGGEGIQGRMQGIGTAMQGMLQTNPKAAAYVSSVNGLRAQIARGLGDVGNLSQTEQENAVKLLPGITDNLETRKAKIQNFRDYVKTKLGIPLTTTKSGGQLMIDAKGNKAMVYPDGSFEEIK